MKHRIISILIVLIYLLIALFGEYGPKLGIYKYSAEYGNLRYCNLPPSNNIFAKVLTEDMDTSNMVVRKASIINSTEYHLLGTDENGKDMLILLCESAFNYLICGAESVTIALLFGLLLGIMTGYKKRLKYSRYITVINYIGEIINNTIDAFPVILIIMIVVIWSDYNIYTTMIFLGVIYSSKIAHIVKDKIGIMDKSGFIEAAYETGLSDRNIIFKQILWYNCRYLLAIQMLYCFMSVIMIESTLSYLGFNGIGWVTWGSIIYSGIGGQPATKLLFYKMYWQSIPAVILIVLTIGCLHFIANTLKKRL